MGETIYRKTARGTQAIATRDAALGPRDRSLLILVDGQRGLRELAAVANAEELLPRLLAQGFIEPVPSSAPVAAPQQPAAAASARAPTPLAKAQRLAVRRLTDLLGPGAEPLCMRLEKTRTAQEFLAVVRSAEGPLRQALGAQVASRFVQEVEGLQPA